MKPTISLASLLLIIGTVLILINTLIITLNESPLIIQSYPISSISEIMPNPIKKTKIIGGEQIIIDEYRPTWGRLSLGIPGIIKGQWIYVWNTLAFINLLLALLYFWRRQTILIPFILILSILSIATGGGFIIGLIMTVIGGCLGIQSKIPLKETFFGKLLRAAKLDQTVYINAKENPHILHESVLVLIFVNILTSLGNSLYVFNANKIVNSTSEIQSRILLQGEIILELSVFGPLIINIGIAVVKWLLLSILIYLIGAKIMKRTIEFDQTARTIAFAYAPVALQVFLPLIFFNTPFLTVYWPLGVFFVTNIWMILALIFATRQLLDVPLLRAVGVIILAGTIYWLIVYKVIVETGLYTPIIQFYIQPTDWIMGLASCAILLSIILGVFSRR